MSIPNGGDNPNAKQGHKPSYQQAIYQSQMMGTIRPAYQNRGSVKLSTTLISIQNNRDNPPEYKLQGLRFTLTQ